MNAPDDVSLALPEGFRPFPAGGDFVHLNGPLYGRKTERGLQLGFRVEQRHCNPMGNCHGGMLATLADMTLPMSAQRHPEVRHRFLPTISLQIDYLAPAPLGAWVQGEGEVLRVTRSLLFMQGLITVDGEPALRASGVFKLGAPWKPPAAAAE